MPITKGGGLATITANVELTHNGSQLDYNYGAVSNNTLRTAAQIGNATGAAAFGAGSTTAQVLRAVLASDQAATLAQETTLGNILTALGLLGTEATLGQVLTALGPLATEATMAAIASQLPATLGQKTMANSLAVTMASDQSALSFSVGGLSFVDKSRLDMSSSNVTTSAYTQVDASTAGASRMIELYNSSPEALILATGAGGSEVDQFYIFPGGNGQIPFSIASGTRLSVKAVAGTANSGQLLVNLYN